MDRTNTISLNLALLVLQEPSRRFRIHPSNLLQQHESSVFDCLALRPRMRVIPCAAASLKQKSKQLREAVDQVEGERAHANYLTYASLLRQCSNAKSLSQGKRLHAQIIRNGYDRDRYLGNLLVHMYGNCGNLRDARAVFDSICEPNAFSWNIMIAAYFHNGHWEDARSMFDKMPQRDVVSWNAMIAAYSQNGQNKEAIELFQRMDLGGVKPDKITFATVLDACTNLAVLAQGRVIHASVVDAELDSDMVVSNALVKMYGKCGSLDDARSVFDKMSQRDVVSWNAMVAAYTQNGHGTESLKLLHQMDLDVVKPNKVTFMCLLDVCTSLADVAQGKKIHRSIIDHGYESHVVVGTALVTMYGKCASLDDARSVFNKMSRRNVVSWNAMITAYAQNGHGREALELLYLMHLESVEPNKVTFLCIIDACASLAALGQGRVIHAMIVDKGLESDVMLGTALVNMYGKCGSLDNARSVFDAMPYRNAVSWNAMIAAYAQNGHGKTALQVFQQMDLEGIKPGKVTFISILDSCASLTALVHGKRIHASIAKSGFESDVVVGNSLINMYGRCGSLGDAKNVFDKMPQRNVVSWTTIIGAYTQNGHGREALELLRQMDLEGVKPNKVTFISVLDACAGLAALSDGKRIHATIADNGFESDVVVATALVNMYGKCGSLHDARSVFDKMAQRNVVSWNAMLAAYAQNGHGKDALKLFQSMNLEVMKPDRITFMCIFSACSHAGLLDDGWHHFVSMSRDHGITPTSEHYGCMIDLIGRVGWLAGAEDLIINMPFEPDAVAWMTLLGACGIHGDVERGANAAKHFIKLDPDNAAAYVMLSNIFAAAGRRDDVAKVRNAMVDRALKKHPGCSCIEVNDRVHKFAVGDTSHRQKEEIYAELQRLSMQMEVAGYMPDTKAILHDVEEAEKEHMLCYHSEKLAIAFGLISTPAGAPLHIIKNLRVCSDCHAATKVISKIAGRRIIVRDTNRFHHYEHGMCSCGDYW